MVEQMALNLERKPARTNRRPTQVDVVRDYLERGNSITDAECRDLFGFTRLADIAFKIRARLVDSNRRLITENVRVLTRRGTITTVGRYYLEDRASGARI